MTLVSNSIKVKEPDYFHRDYKNDLKIDDLKKAPKTVNQGLRVAKAALPFIALYKPAGTALSVVMGGCRAISNASQTYQAYSEGKGRLKIAGELLHTTIAVVSVGCAFFALPLGMLVTSCHDLAMNCIQLHQAWHEKDPAKAREMAREAGLQILTNAVYLGLFFTASLEVLVASIALQILVGLYQTSGEFQKGNYLEVGAGLLMVAVRMNQMAKPVSTLQSKWKAESANKKAINVDAIVNCNTAKSDISVNSSTSPELVNVLVKYGNNPEGIPPLHYASLIGDEKAVTLLLDNGASPNALSIQAVTDYTHKFNPRRPLDFAAMKGHLNVMDILLKRGAQINVSEIFDVDEPLKWSPSLYFAAKHDQGQAVSFLLNKGALLQPSREAVSCLPIETSPLFVAIQKGSLKALDALYNHGANIHSQSNPNYGNWLHIAVQQDQPRSVEWLVKHKIDVNSLDLHGQTALHAAMTCHVNATNVECLLKNGANPNIRNQHGWTPLFLLVEYNPTPGNRIFDKAKLLIEHGADINPTDDQQRTIFERLISRIPVFNNPINPDFMNDSLETAELLLKQGYNINRRNSQNHTVLHGFQNPNLNELHKKIKDWLVMRGAVV